MATMESIDSYRLVSQARMKLSREINKQNYDLRILLSHSVLLDNVIESLKAEKTYMPTESERAHEEKERVRWQSQHGDVQFESKEVFQEDEEDEDVGELGVSYDDDDDDDDDSASCSSSDEESDEEEAFESLMEFRNNMLMEMPQKQRTEHGGAVTFSHESWSARSVSFLLPPQRPKYKGPQHDNVCETIVESEREYESESDSYSDSDGEEYSDDESDLTLYEHANIFKWEDDSIAEDIDDMFPLLTRVSSHQDDCISRDSSIFFSDISEEDDTSGLPQLMHISSSSSEDEEDEDEQSKPESPVILLHAPEHPRKVVTGCNLHALLA